MSLPGDIRDREHKKFVESPTRPGQTAVETIVAQVWDELSTTFPAPNQDLFTYKNNGETVQTILVTYDSADKKQILSVKRTRF